MYYHVKFLFTSVKLVETRREIIGLKVWGVNDLIKKLQQGVKRSFTESWCSQVAPLCKKERCL